jgi:hypothetical protein
MANTYTLIASNTLGSSAASVTFSAIPNTFTDLVLKFSARAATDTSPASCSITLNSDTTNGSMTWIRVVSGPAVESDRNTASPIFNRFTSTASDETANTFSNGEFYLPNYAGTANKPASLSTVNEANVTTTLYSPSVQAGLARITSAITSIEFKQLSGNLASGSSFFLYGIKNS